MIPATAAAPGRTRAVFFDAVGTLLHPDPPAPAAYAAAARRHGVDLPAGVLADRFRRAFHAEELLDRDAGWATDEGRELARWRRVVAATLPELADPEPCFRELWAYFATPAAWRADPAAAAVLGDLTGRGLAVGLGSNYDARVWPVLDGFPELAPLRGRAVVSAAVGARKPAAAFFAAVVRAAGCEPAEVLFVGDDLDNDFRGATAAGLRAVLVDPHGRHPGVAPAVADLSHLPGLVPAG